jgi:septum formation protein
MSEGAELILASASVGRATVLRNAGLRFRQAPAAIDERALEARMLARDGGLDAEGLAAMLASEKARATSVGNGKALVIGADQVMECDGAILHKPEDREAARAQLHQLRGRTHNIYSAIAVASAGETRWQHVDCAQLTMRAFSDAFLDDYIAGEEDGLLLSVGCYRIEGRGIQLFSRVEGDHFTIIGLPLLPLLGYLRECGWLAS